MRWKSATPEFFNVLEGLKPAYNAPTHNPVERVLIENK
ncbi:MAG: hypothetical protein BMS9Abin33_0928 [Gammaproteobacteria bacterium]|nr:MAG: hypothetical protein BMS9Abin33_0928 [Gammaproteobacteria bacterium]